MSPSSDCFESSDLERPEVSLDLGPGIQHIAMMQISGNRGRVHSSQLH